MKPLFALLFLLFISHLLFSQDNKGKIFIETGVKVAGGTDYQSFIGKTGFSYTKSKWFTYHDDGSLWQEGSNNISSWAIAPRVGYCLSKKLQAGIDGQYYHTNLSYGIKYQNLASGIFFRYYFLDHKINPFLELSSGLCYSREEEDGTSSGGGSYVYVEKYKLFYYSGSAGVSFEITNRFNLNLSAKIQNTKGKEIEDNDGSSISYITEKTENLEVVPMLSVTYYFKRRE